MQVNAIRASPIFRQWHESIELVLKAGGALIILESGLQVVAYSQIEQGKKLRRTIYLNTEEATTTRHNKGAHHT
jgi:hypothetical protein